jgi:hypothetical protein
MSILSVFLVKALTNSKNYSYTKIMAPNITDKTFNCLSVKPLPESTPRNCKKIKSGRKNHGKYFKLGT